MSDCNNNIISLKTQSCNLDVAPLEWVTLVPLKKEDGTDFEISALTKTVLQGLIAQALPLNRIYPIDDDVDGVENTTGDPVIQTTEKGVNYFVKNGVDSLAFRIDKTNPAWIRAMESFRGVPCGVIGFDVNGNFQYYTDIAGEGKILPIPLDTNTLSARLIKGTYEAVSNVTVNVDFQSGYNPGLIKVVNGEDLDFVYSDLSPLTSGELSTLDSATTSKTVVTLKDLYGSNITGFVIGDFTVNNLTTEAEVTLTTITDNEDGTYDLNYSTGATAADELQVVVSKDGYDFYALSLEKITVSS